MTTGWQCPQCGRVYSPEVTECAHCNANAWLYTPPAVIPMTPYTPPDWTRVICAQSNPT